MIVVKARGAFDNTQRLLTASAMGVGKKVLKKVADKALSAVKEATPVRTGRTRDSWYYTITIKKGVGKIEFKNSNIQSNGNVALLVDMGHAMPNGVWIEGRNYIDPAMMPVFERAQDELWRDFYNNRIAGKRSR